VCGGIRAAQISLGFNNASTIPAAAVSPGKPRPDDLAGDIHGIATEEFPRKLLKTEALRVKKKTCMGD
jgi:hypothetical protein